MPDKTSAIESDPFADEQSRRSAANIPRRRLTEWFQDLPFDGHSKRKLKEYAGDYENLAAELGAVAERFFPKEFASYKPPSFFKCKQVALFYVQERNRSIVNRKIRAIASKDMASEKEAFLAASALRYVDNFIDEALWPNISRYQPEELQRRFESFLQGSLQIARRISPSMTEQIIELPRLEMKLALDPTQEAFDANITNLVRSKSFDIEYVRTIWTNGTYDPEKPLPEEEQREFITRCLMDWWRDFDSTKKDKDFNIRTHMLKNNLKSDALRSFILSFLKEESPRVHDAYLSKNDSPYDLPDDVYADKSKTGRIWVCLGLLERLDNFDRMRKHKN